MGPRHAAVFVLAALAFGAVSTVSITGASGASGWHRQPSPTPSGRVDVALNSVACPSASSCFAVGSSADPNNFQVNYLIERWNGAHWKIDSSLDIGAGYTTDFDGVSCASTSYCVAVGQFNEDFNEALLAVWNGSTWQGGAVAGIAGVGAELYNVSCPAAGKCLAVGDNGQGNDVEKPGPLVLRVNGSKLTYVSVPGVKTTDDIRGVACVNASNCWIVGARGGLPLGVHWNGSSWSVHVGQGVPGRSAEFVSVACQSATSCWGVGDSTAGSDRRRMVQHWDGSKWAIAVTPAPSASNAFVGVSCTKTQCVASGLSNNTSFIDRWNGSSWSIESTPDLTASEFLRGVSCASATTCVAVGADGAGKTLIERRG